VTTAVAPARRSPAPPPRRAAPAARPSRAPSPPRPALRVAARPARRFPLAGLAIVGTILALVTAVVFHVMLAEGQLELDHLQGQIGHAQTVYEQRRLQVASLSAPSRIIAAAQQRGLVLPTDPATYLWVPGAMPAATPTHTASTLGDFEKVKPRLGDAP
jgi:hypothetical protein